MNNTQDRTTNYGYIIAASCFSIQAIGIGTYVAFGVFFSPLINEFGWPRATIAGASSTAFLIMGFLGILVGRLNDRIGPRKMMTITALFFGLGHFLMSRVGAVWQLYLFYGVFVGIGLSSIDVIALTTTARWFDKRRGLMTGIVKVGTGAGQLIFPLAASLLIAGFGWRVAYIVIGTAVALMLVVIAQFLKRDPSQLGLPTAPNDETKANVPFTGDIGLTLAEATRTRQFWTICATSLVIISCLMTVVVHIVTHAQDMAISAAQAAGVLSTVGGVSMGGRFLTGLSIDRIGSRKAMLLAMLFLLAGLLWLQVADRLWMLYIFSAIYGIAHGGFFTSISPMMAEFFGLKAHGALFGVVAFCGTVGGALGPIVAGRIFDVSGGYGPAFWLCFAMGVVGFVLIYSLKPIMAK
jgi:MFS family permease